MCSPVKLGDDPNGVSTIAFAPKAITPAVSPFGRLAICCATRLSAAARCDFAESDASSSTHRAVSPDASSTDGPAIANASTVSNAMRIPRVTRRFSIALRRL